MRTNLHGRNKIYSAIENINEANVVSVLNSLLDKHYENVADEDYLYWYRRGLQPILYRTKQIRPEINNKVVNNIASEIVAFKNGYLLTQPTFYVSRKNKNRIVNSLNDYLYASGKNEADNVCIDWCHTVGLGVIYVESSKDEDAPVKCYGMDPRQAFVVYSRRPGNEPLFGVNIVVADGVMKFDVITNDHIYRLEGGQPDDVETERYIPKGYATRVIGVEINSLGEIPIIEYTYDRNRMGAFESVLPLLDALNNITSNRADGVEQFIQSLMIFYNCSLGNDDDGNPITPSYIRESGAIFLKSIGQDKADLKILSEHLNQSETQVLINDLQKQICDIAGMPFTSSMTSSSDNVGAVYLRSGWATADTMARNTEDCYREANRRFDKVFIKVLAQKDLIRKIKPSEIEIQFTRNEMDNLLVKTQGALNLKQLGLSPELVLAKSGVSNDPSGDVARSGDYIKIAYGEQGNNEDNDRNDRDDREDIK